MSAFDVFLIIFCVCVALFWLFAVICAITGYTNKWICKYLGWHQPNDEAVFSGVSLCSTCKCCGKIIMQDSQGNWFDGG